MKWKLSSLTPRTNAIAAGLLLLSVAGTASAGSFAIKVANVQMGLTLLYPGQSTTLSYSLLGAGANVTGGLVSVKIEFLKGTDVAKTITIPAGNTGAMPGANTLTLNAADIPAGGPYTVRVTATGGSVTSADYLPVSSAGDPNLQFVNPRGIAINRITGNANKGRIYVTEGGGGATANRVTVDGLYILNPDLTPAFSDAKATSANFPSGIDAWGSTANSPFRPYVTPDGSILITDASDAHCGLFAADADGNNLKAFFAYPYPTGGSRDNNLVYDSIGSPLYGSVSAVWIEGTGAGRVLYTTDEDLTPGNSVHKYAIGTGTQDLSVMPDNFSSFSAQNWYEDFVKDSAGNFYIVSNKTDDANKLDASGFPISTLPSTGTTYLSIFIDDARNVILIGGADGKIYKTTKSFDTVTPLFSTPIGTNVRGVAIDPEGWIYAVSSTDMLLHVWAPAGTYAIPNGTADVAQTLTIVGSPTPGDVSPVGSTGLFTGPNGRKFGDGKINMADAIAVLRIAAGVDIVP